MKLTNEENISFKSGIVALVGKTNAGKSTLLNSILGEKVSIVSDRVQTTRNLIRAILNLENSQIVFLDTPGIHYGIGDMGAKMNKIAREIVKNVDAIILVIDSLLLPDDVDKGWFKRIKQLNKPLIIACNKTDVSTKNIILFKNLWDELEEENNKNKSHWINISALKNNGLDKLTEKIIDLMPLGPKLFPEDVLTDYPIKLNISDIIREKLINKLHKELPHSIAVWVDEYNNTNDLIEINAFVYVERHSQKGIVIGNKGLLIKKVRIEAESELNEIYQKKHSLKLKVKVEKNWRKNFWIMKKLGYS